MMSVIVKTLTKRKGPAARKIATIPSFDIAEQTLRQLPTGGVHAPIAKLETRIMPSSLIYSRNLYWDSRNWRRGWDSNP